MKDHMSVLTELCQGGQHRYSLGRALRGGIGGKENRGIRPVGFEGEVSQEIAKRLGKHPQGFYMPLDAPIEGRSDTTVTGSGAAATVWPPLMFIDVLRAKLVVQALGGQITTLSTESGQVQLPVQTAATPTTWVAEGAAASSFTGLTVSSVTFVPHTILCNTGITRFMRDVQAPGFDAWIYADLAKSIAVSVDAAAINGTGAANNQPIGVLQNSSATGYTLAADSGNGGAPAYADLVGMEKTLSNSNADSRADARLGWLTSPSGRSKLRRTDSSSGNAGQWVWGQGSNTMLGYPAIATTNVPNNLTEGSGTSLTSLILGDWTNLIVNLFSAVDVLFNPFTITTQGYYRIYAYQEADVQIGRGAGFVVANGMITA